MEHLPPSPPPPPAPTVTTTSTPSSGAPPPAAPPPPPPPPPSDQMNGLRITNGDLKNNILVCVLHLKISIPETEFIYLFSDFLVVFFLFYVKTTHEFDQLFVYTFQNGKSSSPTKTDGTGSSQMILPKKKQMQPPHVSAQDGVRSDLLKAIRDGKNLV